MLFYTLKTPLPLLFDFRSIKLRKQVKRLRGVPPQRRLCLYATHYTLSKSICQEFFESFFKNLAKIYFILIFFAKTVDKLQV